MTQVQMQNNTGMLAFLTVPGIQDLRKGLDGTVVPDADCTDVLVLVLVLAAKPIHD